MQNLRDKLLKAGLVSEDQAKKAEDTSTARRNAPPQGQRREGAPSERPEREAREPQERREARPPPRGRDDRPPPRREGGRPQGGRPQAGRPQGGPQGGRPQGGPPGGRPGVEAARPVPKLPPMPGSREFQRLESKKQAELDKKLRELVLGGQVPVDVGATVFYFMTRKGKLRRLELTEPQAKQLEEGVLAVVERPEPAQIEHSLVPAAVAEQMYALSKKSVRFLNRKDLPIGFMSDDDVKAQQAAEAAGEEPKVDEEDAPSPEGEEPGAAAASEEPAASSEPTPE